MSDDIILRAAKAISPEWDRMSANSRRNAVLTVRGVFAAAKIPTPAMLKVGADCLPDMDRAAESYAVAIDDAGSIWQAMIDAALAHNTV